MIKQGCIANASVCLNLIPRGIRNIQDACVFWEEPSQRAEEKTATLIWLIFRAPQDPWFTSRNKGPSSENWVNLQHSITEKAQKTEMMLFSSYGHGLPFPTL